MKAGLAGIIGVMDVGFMVHQIVYFYNRFLMMNP